jgi:ribosomal protein S16
MADYKERFESWQKKATEKFGEIDAQLGLKDKLEGGAKAVVDSARTGAERLKTEAEKSEVGKRAVKVAEDVVSTASGTAKTAWSASEPLRDAAAHAGTKAGGAVVDAAGRAGEILEDAKEKVGTNAKRVSAVVGFGAGLSSTFDSLVKSAKKASDWVQNDPVRAATTGVSMAVGAGLGVVFTGITSHWLLNSAIPTWSVKKVAQEFDAYLKRREDMIAKGRLSEADADRIRFERDIAKRIGAPLLGAFSFASGAVMLSNVFNPAAVTGFPLGNIIGGNPVLEGVWFFGNGMVCFKTSYDFFMIALEGDEDVEKMVREIKGMLPAGA